MSPMFSIGANTALRVPTTIEAPPFLIRFHSSSRSVIESPLCRTATRPPKYRRNRSIIWGVREISGTIMITPRPPSSTWRMVRRKTSVLPEPVTP